MTLQVVTRETIRWARDRRWLSAATVRRRLRADKEEAESIIQGLVLARVLHPRPEGTVYRVRYPRRTRLEPWLNPKPQDHTYLERP